MEIEPGQPFTIWRKLEDPNDSTTYYVQATLYDMRDNSTIQTVNLTDQGGRIFSKSISAPNDSSGQGRWIAISTRVYTDSGYTTLSEIKKEESREYKVIARRMAFGGGGSSGPSLKEIREAVGGLLEKLPKPELFDPESLVKLIQAVSKKVDGIKMPTTDLAPVLEAIRGLPDMVVSKVPQPEKPEKIDWSPVMSALQEISLKMPEASEKTSQFIKELKDFMTSFANSLESDLQKGIKDMTNKAEGISNLTFTVKPSLPEGEESEPNKKKREGDGLSRAKGLIG